MKKQECIIKLYVKVSGLFQIKAKKMLSELKFTPAIF